MSAATAPIEVLPKRVTDLAGSAQKLAISNVDEYLFAGELSKSITAMLKEVGNSFDPIVKKAYEAHKEAVAQKKKLTDPLEESRRRVDVLILAWDRDQEKKRREEEQRLQLEAQRQQEEDAVNEAAQLERIGESDLANYVIDRAAEAPAPVVSLPPAAPRIEGLSKRVLWRWRVTDPDLVPREYLAIDEVKVGGVIRALKDKARIPGISIYPEDSAIHHGR